MLPAARPQGNYTAALNEYFHAYRRARREPLTLLACGLALLNNVMSKKVADRDRAVITAFAFLQARNFCSFLTPSKTSFAIKFAGCCRR